MRCSRGSSARNTIPFPPAPRTTKAANLLFGLRFSEKRKIDCAPGGVLHRCRARPADGDRLTGEKVLLGALHDLGQPRALRKTGCLASWSARGSTASHSR